VIILFLIVRGFTGECKTPERFFKVELIDCHFLASLCKIYYYSTLLQKWFSPPLVKVSQQCQLLQRETRSPFPKFLLLTKYCEAALRKLRWFMNLKRWISLYFSGNFHSL